MNPHIHGTGPHMLSSPFSPRVEFLISEVFRTERIYRKARENANARPYNETWARAEDFALKRFTQAVYALAAREGA